MASNGTYCPAPQKYDCSRTCRRTCFSDELKPFVERCCNCTLICQTDPWQSYVAFALLACTLLVLAMSKVPFFPFGRTMGTFICAVLMVLLGPLQAGYVLEEPGLVSIGTITTLFGMTVLAGGLKDSKIIVKMIRCVELRATSPCKLVMATITLTTFTSAFLTNDAAVILLTKPIICQCRKLNVGEEPFLIALVTSANIAAAVTLVGSPQNILIGQLSGINPLRFVTWMLPAVLVSILMNLCFLLLFYRRQLYQAPVVGLELTQATVAASQNLMPSEGVANTQVHGATLVDAASDAQRQGKIELATCFIFFVLIPGLLICSSIPWVVLAGVAMLTMVKVFIEQKPGTDVLRHADGPLLVLISALCIIVAGVQLTGVPERLIAKIFTGRTEIALVILCLVVLSNVISNVPVVLLFAPHLKEAGSPTYWLIVSWTTTIAGNLTLVGSLANIIMVEKAAEKQVDITFWSHFKFASWSTVCTTAVGCWLICKMCPVP